VNNAIFEMKKNVPLKSFLRWAGSKRQIIPILSEFWIPEYNRYVEPFTGSASLFFHLLPPKALLADINEELILTFTQIKENPSHVYMELSNFKKNKEQYLYLRSLDSKTLSKPMKAARFIYLNRFCFNGLYRINKLGQFNVPYSGNQCGQLPSEENLLFYSKLLKNTKLHSEDFEKTLEKVETGDFVYMDPPYVIKSKRVFNEYSANVFDNSKIEILRDWLVRLNDNNISFLVSYADSKEAKFLSENFNTMEVSVRRNIAGFINDRKVDKEILIFNKNI
jgi:DNA adenine methylase